MTTAAAQPAEKKPSDLRPEARPRPFEALDPRQQAAFRRVVELLYATAEAVSTRSDGAIDGGPGRAGGPPLPDVDRSSRNILVDGERGTGKTTLLLSLARALLARPDPYQEQGDDGLPLDLASQLDKLRRRLVWLETLDMEPLSNDANLLGAVLARIEDAVGTLLPTSDDSTVASLLYPTRNVHDIPRELLRLQTSIALIFDGNLRARAGSLDPDTFAVEARRTERERLGLDRRFTEVLGALSDALAARPELHKPVFVLPVDDLDLNPSDCVPLLRLLRSAHSPHLVVIMAADVGLLSTILRLKYRGDLARISSPLPLTDEDRVRADDLANSAFRKHLPPSQQVHLMLVEPARALTYRADGVQPGHLITALRGVDLPPDHATLWVDSWFAGLPGPDPAEPVTAGPLLPERPGDENELRNLLKGYSWPEALRLPLRQVIDLHLGCAAGGADGDAKPTDGHADKAQAVRDAARTRLQRWRSASADPQRFTTPETGPPARLSTGPELKVGQHFVIATSRFHGWRIHTGSGPLPAAEAAAYVGSLELAGDDVDMGPGFVPPIPSVPSLRETRLPETGLVVPWPWVTHSRFWAYERAVRSLEAAERQWVEQPDLLFGSWIAVMTAQLFGDPPDPQRTAEQQPREWFGQWDPVRQPGTWEALIERLDRLPDTDPVRRWRIAVGLLCTPEMGMPSPRLPQRTGDLSEEVGRQRQVRRRDLPEASRALLDEIAPLPTAKRDPDPGGGAGRPTKSSPKRKP